MYIPMVNKMVKTRSILSNIAMVLGSLDIISYSAMLQTKLAIMIATTVNCTTSLR